MAQGIDCSTALSPTLAKTFYDQGYRFVGRYLADQKSWKRLSPSEAKTISDAGMYIVSFMERYANRVAEGAKAGVEDGKAALSYAREVAQPEGTTIYFCVDYDAQPKDYDVIEQYLRAAGKEINGYELGVYGSYFVVKEMYERGVCKKLAQTVAWSKGKKYENACFYQAQIDVKKNGIGVDLDETNGDAGGWKVGMLASSDNKKNIDDDVVDFILEVMSDYWNRMKGNTEAQEYTHYCSNELRKLVGRKEE